MHRKTLPNSSACCLPEGVNSPPHFKINSKEASLGESEYMTIQILVLNRKHFFLLTLPVLLPSSELEFLGLPLG